MRTNNIFFRRNKTNISLFWHEKKAPYLNLCVTSNICMLISDAAAYKPQVDVLTETWQALYNDCRSVVLHVSYV